ncbi:MAG TPA: hypothetical protein VLM79_07945 [Kofleriaceae bacterium]|nr:hypothetical protein [Kofleriaceae bacterium]
MLVDDRRCGAFFEREQQRIGRTESISRISLDEAIDDRGQRRIDTGAHRAQARDLALLDCTGKLVDRDIAKWRRPGEQLVQ